MLDDSLVSPDQTHLGWRTLPADGNEGQDHLVLRDPFNGQESISSDEPLVTFLEEEETAQELGGAVEDATVEAPSFLWSSNRETDTTATPPGRLNNDNTPVVVFREQTAASDSATIFS